MNPLISVIVPVYNGASFLPEAIQTIRNQNYGPIEILIVDDGSKDETKKVAESFGSEVSYFFQINQGPAAARNLGIQNARGEFIAFLDVDDLFPSNKFTRQLEHFKEKPELQVVFGLVEWAYLEGALDELKSRTEEANVNLGTGLYRREVFQTVGLFDEEQRYSEDVDWVIRCREKGINLLFIDEVMLLYRQHASNMTRRTDLAQDYFVRALKKSLDRRRREGKDNPKALKEIPGVKEWAERKNADDR